MVYKLLKKGISLALAFVIVLSLSCCGVGDEVLIDEITSETTSLEATESTLEENTSTEITTDEVTEKIYEYDDYTIEYNIISSGTNDQNINITISNTGKESIIGWTLKYDAGGEISDLWDGTIYKNNETEYIIRSADHNYVIEPGSSVAFGYTLTGDELAIPESIEICSKRVVKVGGYEVEFTETNDFGTSFQGEIKISNLTDEPIEAWILTFYTNFVIEELSGAKIISQYNIHYEVADQQWTTPIQPNSTVVLGLSGSKEENVQPEIKIGAYLSEIVFDDKLTSDIPDEPDISDDDDDDGIYMKPITSEDEIAYKDTGFAYVRNQILLMADDSISFDEMSDIADDMNADIVGYIDITNEYQIEFRYNVELEDLENIIDDLEQKPFIEYAALNYAFELHTD
ncbi:MAG: cellulose binding domain-containing protein [Oscillospiraceae bacterium]|nr:cellulose binding domain-containing protein [Oscillospiraceae bacterium]